MSKLGKKLIKSAQEGIEIAARARVFEYIAQSIEDDAEWFVDDSIDDADIADGLRIAAKALRTGFDDKKKVPTK